MKNAPMHNLRPIFTSLIIALAAQAIPSQADDFEREGGARGDTYCFPAKHAIKTIEQLAAISDDYKEVVEIKMAPRFLIYDGGILPERYYLRAPASAAKSNTDALTDVVLTSSPEATVEFTMLEDGTVPDFVEKVEKTNPLADICVDDKARAGLPEEDESLYFEMGLTPYFKNRSGHHDMAELKQGVKDGKTQYKKMVPAPVRVFMPDTNYLHVKYENTSAPVLITAYSGESAYEVPTDFYNEGHVFSVKDLINQDVERIEIKGGAYKLSPVPSIKTMKRFGIGKPRGPQKTVQNVTAKSP